MGYFQVRYDSRVIIYYCRAVIRLATGGPIKMLGNFFLLSLMMVSEKEDLIFEQSAKDILALIGM